MLLKLILEHDEQTFMTDVAPIKHLKKVLFQKQVHRHFVHIKHIDLQLMACIRADDNPSSNNKDSVVHPIVSNVASCSLEERGEVKLPVKMWQATAIAKL